MFIRLLVAACLVSASVLLGTPAKAARVAGPGTPAAVSASLTTRDLDGIAIQIDVLAAAGAFKNSGIAKSLKAKVNSARKPAEQGDAAAVNRIMNAFANDVAAVPSLHAAFWARTSASEIENLLPLPVDDPRSMTTGVAFVALS